MEENLGKNQKKLTLKCLAPYFKQPMVNINVFSAKIPFCCFSVSTSFLLTMYFINMTIVAHDFSQHTAKEYIQF